MNIVATGLPATIEDYQVALNAAFAGGEAFGKAQQRKPLTREEIADLRHKHGITSDGRGIKEFTQVVDFVRDIEAHGIKE